MTGQYDAKDKTVTFVINIIEISLFRTGTENTERFYCKGLQLFSEIQLLFLLRI